MSVSLVRHKCMERMSHHIIFYSLQSQRVFISGRARERVSEKSHVHESVWPYCGNAGTNMGKDDKSEKKNWKKFFVWAIGASSVMCWQFNVNVNDVDACLSHNDCQTIRSEGRRKKMKEILIKYYIDADTHRTEIGWETFRILDSCVRVRVAKHEYCIQCALNAFAWFMRNFFSIHFSLVLFGCCPHRVVVHISWLSWLREMNVFGCWLLVDGWQC